MNLTNHGISQPVTAYWKVDGEIKKQIFSSRVEAANYYDKTPGQISKAICTKSKVKTKVGPTAFRNAVDK